LAISIGEIEATLRLRDELTSQLKFAQQQLAETGAHLQKIGRQVREAGSTLTLGLTVPLVAAGTAALKFSADFQTAMTKVGTLTNIGVGGIAEMRKEIIKLSPAVGVGPKALADGLLVVASTGLKGAEALSVLEQSAKGTAVGLGETKDIARAVTAAILAYGSENLNAAEATNKLFVAVREGGAEANEFAGTLGRVVGIASQVGVSFDEVLASMATFTRLGVKADEAATALRGVMGTLLKPSKGAAEALASVGMSVDELRKNVREKGLTAALTDLVEKTKDNDEAMAAIIPNVRALSGVMGTAGSQATSYAATLEAVKNGTTEMDEAFKVTSKTLGFQWNVVVAKAEGILLKFGDAIAPAFASLLKLGEPILAFISGLADSFGALPEPVKMAAVAVGLLLAALGPGVYIFGSWIQMAGFAVTGFSALQKALLGATTAATTNVVAIEANAAATVANTAATVIDVAATMRARDAKIAYTVALWNTIAAMKFAQSTQLALGTGQLALAGSTAAAAGSMKMIGGTVIHVGEVIEGVAVSASQSAPAMGLFGRAVAALTGPIGWFIGAAALALSASGSWSAVGRILVAVARIIGDQFVREVDHFVAVVKMWADVSTRYGGPIIKFLDDIFGISSAGEGIKKGLTAAAEGLERFQGATRKAASSEELLDRAKKAMADIKKAQLALSAGGIDADKTMEQGITLDALAASASSLTARLDEARAAVAHLTPEQRANIAAGREMGLSVEDITKALNHQWPELRLTEQSVQLYKEQLEQTAKEADKFADAMKRVAAAAVPLTERQKKLAIGFENLGLSAEEMSKAVGAAPQAIEKYFKSLDNLAELQQWVTEKQREMLKAMSDRALAQGNADIIKALKDLTAARNASVDALLTGTDAEVRAIERRRDADIEAIRAETHEMQWNKDERVRLRKEQADREVALAKGMYGQIEALANLHGIKTKMQLMDEWATQKMVLDFMLQNEKLFTEQIIEEQRKRVKATKDAAKGAMSAWRQAFAEGAKAVRDVASAWSELAQVTEAGSPERAFAEVAGKVSIIAGDVQGLLEADSIIKQIVASIKLAVDAAKMLWDALSVSNGEDIARRIGKGWGIKIGEELGDAIWETAKKTFHGDKFAAELAHMQDIISEGAKGAGVSKEVFIKANFDQLVGQLRNVFALVEMGTLNVAQAGKIIDENFDDILKAGTSAYGLVNQKIIETIQLTQRLGIESKAVTKFLQEQSSMASSGLNLIATGTIGNFNRANEQVRDAGDALVEAREKVDRLQASIADLKKKGITTEKQRAQMALWIRQLADAQTEVSMLEQQIKAAESTLKAAGVTGQKEFDRLGRLAVVAFAAGIGSGKSFLDMMNEIGPALDEASKAQQTFGFEATGAFKDLVELRRFIKDNKELVGTLDGVNKMMVGLKNSSMLTQDTFTDLTTIARDTFDKMVKGGLSSKQALILMQPTLQTVWELQQDFGFAVDEATQKLIDQGIEAGVVGEQHRSAADKMVIALDRVVGVLELIAVALGVTLPDAAKQGAEKAQKELDGIEVPDLHGKIIYDFPTGNNVPIEFPTSFPTIEASTGGMVLPSGALQHFQFGGIAGPDVIPSLLAPGETVRTPQQELQVQREIKGARQPIVVQLYLDRMMLAEVVVDGVEKNGKVLKRLSRVLKQIEVK
jgi:TP901 family phage tail tape measure protein